MEIGMVLILALIVFGPKKLPDLGRSLGKGIREFKGSVSGENEHEVEHPAAIAATRADGDRAEPAPVAKTPA
jgi:sec-independent protein translocase protein TatA